MATTPSTMILAALIMSGEKPMGGSLTSAEQTHWLARLNAMMESWSLDELYCYTRVQDSKALTASVGSITIGSGATWNTARPTEIVDPVFVRDSTGADSPLEIIDAETYGRITLKTLDGSYPRYLYYDKGYTTAYATVNIYPEPVASLTLYINSWKQLQQFSAISTDLAMPPGYQYAIELSFAVFSMLGQRPVPTDLEREARSARAAIKKTNSTIGLLGMDAALPGIRGPRSNILTGV
jgi:hypothetical protein